jgi:hypothetical protein
MGSLWFGEEFERVSVRKDDSMSPAKKKAEKIPFTIENVLKAVARECHLAIENLEASEATPGKEIEVDSKDGNFFASVTVSRQWEEAIVLSIFMEHVREGWALPEMTSVLGDEVLFNVLMDTVRLSDLRPWVTYKKRDDFHGYVWKKADFWSDWEGQGFKLPSGAPSRSPTDAECKRLEWADLGDEIDEILGDRKKLVAFLDEEFHDYEMMISTLVSQCYFDEVKLAKKCIEAVGGVEGYCQVKEIQEGFMIRVEREERP